MTAPKTFTVTVAMDSIESVMGKSAYRMTRAEAEMAAVDIAEFRVDPDASIIDVTVMVLKTEAVVEFTIA